MKACHRILTVTVLGAALLSPSLHAQRLQGDLQQQMSAEQFRAAGLEKLSAQELATLNRWLQGTVDQATAQVREQAMEEGRQEIMVKTRGFLDFGSREPITGTITGGFSGLGMGRQYTLDNGQVWEQTEARSLSGVRDAQPAVRITPGLGVWYLQLEGFNTRAKVRRIK